MKDHAVDYIVVHCSATKATQDIGRDEIDRWHKQKGWKAIGYHFVIRRNGLLERGRPLDDDDLLEPAEGEVGAHVEGFNRRSVGVCLVGGSDDLLRPARNFTQAQYDELEKLLLALVEQFPGAEVRGHRDFPGVTKSCPSFDVQAWWANRNRERLDEAGRGGGDEDDSGM